MSLRRIIIIIIIIIIVVIIVIPIPKPLPDPPPDWFSANGGLLIKGLAVLQGALAAWGLNQRDKNLNGLG